MLEIEVKRRGGLEKVRQGLVAAVSKGVKAALQGTRNEAASSAQKLLFTDALSSSIKVQQKGDLAGRVVCDHEQAPFVEFGTGVHAQLPHIGKTKLFKSSGYTMWNVPKEEVKDPDIQTLVEDSEDFYLAFASTPSPFMRVAAFNRQNENAKDVAKEIKQLVSQNKIQN